MNTCLLSWANQNRDYRIFEEFAFYMMDLVDDLPYYSSGIIFVKDDEKAHRFYQEWHNKWKDTLERHHFHYDQPSLTVANVALGFPVHELDGVWNCRIMNNVLPFLNHAKIIHYFANHAVTKKYRQSLSVSQQQLIHKDQRRRNNPPRCVPNDRQCKKRICFTM